jgi:hypothetical protein
MRRKFLWPEQYANGVSDKELMRELDHKESDERMKLDNKHLHEKDIMTLINGGGSHVFDMPFNAWGKTLHKAGVGLNEFDLIIKHSGSVTDLDNAIHEKIFHDMKLQFNGEMAKLFCMQFVLHADKLFLQRSAVLYPAEHFRENGRHFPFNN